MTRLEAIDKLCESYSVYFDVERFEENEDLLAATCFLYVHSEKYVLVKAAKLWEADSNEYVYIFNVPHLTKDVFTKCRDYAHKDGMSRIEPKPGHMCSYITALFICDTCDPDAVRALKRTRIYKKLPSVLLRLDGFPHRPYRASDGENCRKRQWKKYSTAFEKNAAEKT